jgi:hypothetical protein
LKRKRFRKCGKTRETVASVEWRDKAGKGFFTTEGTENTKKRKETRLKVES